MTKEEIQQRYKALILPENKNPFHFEKVDAPVTIEAYNSMCGDKYELYLEEGRDKDIDSVHFHGFGCAISKASTSLMIREIEGKSKVEAKAYIETFLKAVEKGESLDQLPESLKVLAELKNFEGRVDCIQLSWKALLDYLNKE